MNLANRQKNSLQSKVYRNMYPALFFVTFFSKTLDKHEKICGEAP